MISNVLTRTIVRKSVKGMSCPKVVPQRLSNENKNKPALNRSMAPTEVLRKYQLHHQTLLLARSQPVADRLSWNPNILADSYISCNLLTQAWRSL
jgi:hypothetical protein